MLKLNYYKEFRRTRDLGRTITYAYTVSGNKSMLKKYKKYRGNCGVEEKLPLYFTTQYLGMFAKLIRTKSGKWTVMDKKVKKKAPETKCLRCQCLSCQVSRLG